jgi:hypothetical protein
MDDDQKFLGTWTSKLSRIRCISILIGVAVVIESITCGVTQGLTNPKPGMKIHWL